MTTLWPAEGSFREHFLIWIALALGLSETGCAHLSYENYGHLIGARGNLSASELTPAGLVISGTEETELSSAYTGLVAVAFENRSPNWIRFQSMTVSFGGPEKDRAVFVPMGDDLASWQRAVVQRNSVRELNRAMALGAIAVTGAVVANTAAARRNRPVAATAAAVSVTSQAALIGTQVGSSVDSVERVPMYPETHLLAMPLTVAPGLFTKRWIVLSTPGRARHPCIDSILLDYTLEDGRRERVWLTFRPRPNRSEWQSDDCPLSEEP